MPDVTVTIVPEPRPIRCGVNASMTRIVPQDVDVDRLRSDGEVRRVAQVLRYEHADHRDDGVQVRVIAQHEVAGPGDAPGVGHVDLDGAEPLRGDPGEQVRAAAPGDDGAGYLRAWRDLVTPERAGIPAGGSRRVPGLRREEVAMLAGISADYYLRLERGRDKNRPRRSCCRLPGCCAWTRSRPSTFSA